jgi:hypothetical protein
MIPVLQASNASEEAKRLASWKEVLADPRPPNEHDSLSEAYAALGEKDLALDWLERAYQLRQVGVALIKVEPILDPLRGEPRFDALVQRLPLDQR